MKKYRGFQGEVSLQGLGFVRQTLINGSEALPGGFYKPYSPSPPETLVQAGGGMYTDPTHPFYSPPSPTVLPYIDPTTRYTREQILDMIEDRKAAEAAEHEVTYSQNSEGGDGIDEELEQFANEQAATDQAVRDGAGLPNKIGAPQIDSKVVPLAILGLIAYLLF